jgi:hypothetical protein
MPSGNPNWQYPHLKPISSWMLSVQPAAVAALLQPLAQLSSSLQ